MDVFEVFRAVAHAFNQVLGHHDGAMPSNHSTDEAALPLQNSIVDHEHHFSRAIDHFQNIPSDDPVDAFPILQQHGDAAMSTAPIRPSWFRCTQCHRCHDPAKRCRCYVCGNMHHSGLCAMQTADVLRCTICSFVHAPGPCVVHVGPIAANCAQCGRRHLPGARCKCRVCGAMHHASTECNNVRAPSSQDVYMGAALNRQPVAFFDCGSPTDACPHCGALFFDGEAQYLSCCRKGTVVVKQRTVRHHSIQYCSCAFCDFSSR